MAGLHPRSSYARVISKSIEVPDDGVWRYVVTQPVGQNCWVIKVDVWCLPKAINAAQGTAVSIATGTGDPGSVAALRSWDNVLPMIDDRDIAVPWIMDDGRDHFHWDIGGIYVEKSRRFGIEYLRGLGFGDDWLYVSLQISEG